jgi:hypothetical protein
MPTPVYLTSGRANGASTATRSQQVLGMRHDLAATCLSLIRRCNGQLVDLAAVCIKANHRGCDNLGATDVDRKEVELNHQLAGDILARVVPRVCYATACPQ